MAGRFIPLSKEPSSLGRTKPPKYPSPHHRQTSRKRMYTAPAYQAQAGRVEGYRFRQSRHSLSAPTSVYGAARCVWKPERGEGRKCCRQCAFLCVRDAQVLRSLLTFDVPGTSVEYFNTSARYFGNQDPAVRRCGNRAFLRRSAARFVISLPFRPEVGL